MTLEEHMDNPIFPYWVVWDTVDITGDVRYEQLMANIKISCLGLEMREWAVSNSITVSEVAVFSGIKSGIGFQKLTDAVQFHLIFAWQVVVDYIFQFTKKRQQMTQAQASTFFDEVSGELMVDVPHEIMEEIGIAPGDVIVWSVDENGCVTITKKNDE
jgi:hypothetical protein